MKVGPATAAGPISSTLRKHEPRYFGQMMDMFLLAGLASAFAIAFPAMFSIVNPVGNALTFLNVTAHRSREERSRLARRIGVYSLVILLGSIWFGAYVLGFFGVSIGALRIAGGMVVAVQAWAMLMAPDPPATRSDTVDPNGAASDQDVAFFPLTMPFTTGPGAIAVAIALGSESMPQQGGAVSFLGGISLAAVAIAALGWLIYASADRITRLLGRGGERILSRLVAFLLLCIGIQMLWSGLDDLIGPNFASARSG